MAKRRGKNYQETRYRWNLGIHQQPNFAQNDHVKDCLNVWAPEGEVRLRPGLVNIAGDFFPPRSSNFYSDVTSPWMSVLPGGSQNLRILWYDASTTTWTEPAADSIPIHSLEAEDYLYFGITPEVGDPYEHPYDIFAVHSPIITTLPSVGLRGVAQYWNGTIWRNIPVALPNMAELLATPPQPYQQVMAFKAPKDWAQSTLETYARHWVRIYVSKDVTVGGNCYWDFGSASGPFGEVYGLESTAAAELATLYGVKVIQTPRGLMSLMLVAYNTTSTYGGTSPEHWLVFKQGLSGSSYSTHTQGTLKYSLLWDVESESISSDTGMYHAPARIEYAPEIGRIFVATGYRIFEIDLNTNDYYKNPSPGNFPITERDITLPQTVGVYDYIQILGPETDVRVVDDDRSEFYKGYLAQEQDKLRAGSIAYYDERLFLCAFKDQPRKLQWGMTGLGYKVFPSLAFTYVPGPPEPLLGFFQLGESLYTYDTKSIWKISYTNTDGFGIPHYEATQVVSGVGPVAPGSVVNYVNGVLFLSYDGLVTFNGVKAKKVAEYRSRGQSTDRLAKLWSRINWGLARSYSTAVDWKDKGHYLLTLPIDDNIRCNTVLAWDYENDSLWLWDMDIVGLFDFPGTGGAQQIGALDNTYRPAVLSERHSDFESSIPVSITSHRVGQGQAGTLRLRQLEITTDTDKGRIQAEVGVQDSGTKATFTYDPYDETGATTLDSEKFVVPREKSICKELKKTGERFDIKLSSLDTDEDFLVRDVYVRWIPMGKR